MSKGQGSGAVVEPVALGSQTFTDTELSSLALSQDEQYTSNDYETLASIEAQLECMNAEEVITTEEEEAHTIITECEETETIVPDVEDVEMTEVPQEVESQEVIYTTANQSNQNLILQTKPTLQRLPTTSTVQVCIPTVL